MMRHKATFEFGVIPSMSLRSVLIILLILVLPIGLIYGANNGTITSLSASGGANPGEDITISVSIRANSRVNNSNLYFRIISPAGVVVATHTASPPSMNGGDTWSYSWISNNSSYPEMGTYTVSVCWSPGASQNCQIASASTTFYSADSLGPLLLVGFALVGLLVWRQRIPWVDNE